MRVKSRLRFLVDKWFGNKIDELLTLSDETLRHNRIGIKIRRNFEGRDWLKGKARGNPSKGFRKMKEKLENDGNTQ